MAKKQKINIPEQQLVRQIIKYLNLRGHLVWRNNTGMFKDQRGHWYRFGLKDSADIIGVAKDGRMIAIECKAAGKTPTLPQVHFLGEIDQRGGVALIAYDLATVQRQL